MKIRHLYLVFILLFLFSKSFSQSLSINTDGSIPDPSAILEVKSSNKGILIPRLNLTSDNAPIAGTKPAGLLVWNTNPAFKESIGFYFWDGTTWKNLFYVLNSVTSSGIVIAPTTQNKNTIWQTDYQGNPKWKRANKTMEYINSF